MNVIPWDDLAWEPKPGTVKSAYREAIGVRIDNEDGSKMYAVETVTIEIEEEQVTNKTYVQELLHALKISWPFLALVILAVFGFFNLTQNRIDAQMSEIRVQMAADRKAASDDNAALRNDMTQGFNRVADKLDDIGKTLTAIQVEQAAQKAKSENQK
ncbi:hypothetical protein [Cedecea sp. P7760]|uniref:hypothetical protein n=1 Tax=Cedecea sp. P7760 TaxID=2726983 RepID=UPI0015A3A77B|nr:hypothetical protein [Cedecea sp. P7760]NWC63710.1 hypothetical protein [Cedecea sp. P7760]